MVRKKIFILGTVFLLVCSMLISINFVSARHIVNATGDGITFYALEDVPFKFNVTINNTDFGAAGTAANITRVNITLPSGFSFNPITNRTSATGTFSNLSNVLSWVNATPWLINATNLFVYFEFNATIATPGTYTIIVRTFNATESFYVESNLTVVVNDTNFPIITLNTPEDAVSAADTAYNFTFNLTDDNSVNCTLIVDNVKIENSTNINLTGGTSGISGYSFAVGAHTWMINCTDSKNNKGNSSARTFTVTGAASTTTSSGGGGGSAPEWTSTKVITDTEFKTGVTKELGTDERAKITVGSETHYVGIKVVTAQTATVQVSSTPQTAIFSIGDEKKFDVNNDGTKDLTVKLNSITSNKASLTIKSITEEVVAKTQPVVTQTPAPEVKTTPTTETLAETSGGISWGLWIGVLVIIIAIIALVYYFFVYRKKNLYVTSKKKR